MDEQRNGFTFITDETITLSANELIRPIYIPANEAWQSLMQDHIIGDWRYTPMPDGTIRVTPEENKI